MRNMPIIAVLGSSGQVGQSIIHWSKHHDKYEMVFFDRQKIDMSTGQGIALLLNLKPDIVINASAYTAVDKAEIEISCCISTNAIGVAYLAKICQQLNCPLLHISSDYVYHSISGRPIKETDPCLPRSIYAISKLMGDTLALHYNAKTIVLRTSWVYSPYGHNFVKTMLKLANERSELTIVNDQIGSPTYAPDLVEAMMSIIERVLGSNDLKPYGIYNLASNGTTNWKSFAEEIFAIKNIPINVLPTTTAAYNAPAPRPLWSVMDMGEIKDTFGIVMPDWISGLHHALDAIELHSKA